MNSDELRRIIASYSKEEKQEHLLVADDVTIAWANFGPEVCRKVLERHQGDSEIELVRVLESIKKDVEKETRKLIEEANDGDELAFDVLSSALVAVRTLRTIRNAYYLGRMPGDVSTEAADA